MVVSVGKIVSVEVVSIGVVVTEVAEVDEKSSINASEWLLR